MREVPEPFSHIIVVDPAVDEPHVDCFNQLVQLSPLPLTYHLPALAGMASLHAEPDHVAGIIVMGSTSSVNDRFSWQNALDEWLMPRLSRKTPIFGICWGHQMISRLFGGRVAKLPMEPQLGFRKVAFAKNTLWGLPLNEGSLFVCHEEAVVECPSELEVIGQSELIPVDATKHRTLPIWTFQSHPEAVPTFAARCEHKISESDSFQFGHRLVGAFLHYASAQK